MDLLVWRSKMLAKYYMEKPILFLLNIDKLKDKQVSRFFWAMLWNLAYFEVTYLKCISELPSNYAEYKKKVNFYPVIVILFRN